MATTTVNAVDAAITRITTDLAATGRRWALVGGLAVSARTEPRTTRDVDVAVAVRDDEDAESLVASLLAARYSVHAAVEQLATGRLSTVRLIPPASGRAGAVVDLLFASSGIEPELTARAREVEILPGLVLPVAVVGDLIALKVLSRDDDRRPQDAGDLRALIRSADESDLQLAGEAVELIVARGFHRERDLVALLADTIARYRV